MNVMLNYTKKFDISLITLCHKFAVVHKTIDLHPGIHRSESLMLKVRQAYAAASHPRPYQHRCVIIFKFFKHLC